MAKRLGIYTTYDKEGNLAQYIIYALKEYRKVVDELVVVSNCKLSKTSREDLEFVDAIYERDDTGYDVGAFADFLTNLYGWENVWKFEEVAFMNDSVFGPVYSLEPIIEKMSARKELDFWGLAHRAESDFDGGEVIYPSHIQLYFYVVKSRMLHSDAFVDFWKNISDKITDFRSAIVNYEFAFTKYFEERGFKWDVAVRLPGYDTDNPRFNLSPYHYNMYELVKSGMYPFIKNKQFTGDFVYAKYSDKSDIRKVFNYIRYQTDYDINMIWDVILKKFELGSIIKGMALHEMIVIDESRSKTSFHEKDYRIIDLQKEELVIEKLAEKYVLLISLPEEENVPEPLKQSSRFLVTKNMMSDSRYIDRIIELFETNPRLGVLVPPAKNFGQVTSAIEKTWCNTELVEDYYRELKLTVPFLSDKAPVHEVNAVWCRTSLLQSLIGKEMFAGDNLLALQMLPLVAQEAGYYTEIVENSEYVKYDLFGKQEMIAELYRFLDLGIRDNLTMEQCENESMKKRVKAALSQKTDIYVYGAGERACRLIAGIQGIVNIREVIVSQKEGNPENLLGYSVRAVSDWIVEDTSILMVITVGERYRNAVKRILLDKGFTNFIFV